MTHMTDTLDTFLDLEPIRKPARGFEVVHPLFDEPEEKKSCEHLGPLKLGLGSRIALGSLRLYLIAMVLLATYRVLDFAKVLHH